MIILYAHSNIYKTIRKQPTYKKKKKIPSVFALSLILYFELDFHYFSH